MAKSASPLEYVDNLATTYSIPEQLSYTEKVLYLSRQIDEFKSVIFRHQVDVLLSEDLINSKNPQVATQGAQNKANYTAVIEQMAGAMRKCAELRAQLEPLAEAETEED
jgi:hypothetical protein